MFQSIDFRYRRKDLEVVDDGMAAQTERDKDQSVSSTKGRYVEHETVMEERTI